MSTLSKSVLTEPAAAAAAGCYATCTAYVENKTREVTFIGSDDKGYRTFSNYKLEAFPANGWTFREFIYTDTWTDTDGVTHTTERHRHPANSGTVYPSTLHTEYETDPSDWTSVEPADKHIDARPTNSFSNVKAVFDAPGTITHTVSAYSSPASGGTVQVGPDEPGTSSSYIVTNAQSITLVAIPASGYVFDGWYLGGSSLASTSETYTIQQVFQDRAFEARFKPLAHIVVTTFKSAGRVHLNGIPGDDIQSAWTVVSADIPVGDSVTITATPIDPNVHPFKAWYLNPSAWGNPEQTGTLVSGAGATYAFTASANATYFATFEGGGSVVVSTTPSEAQPEAKVSINGQTNNTYKYSLDVPTGSTVTVSASERGGPSSYPYFDRYYFEGWIDNDYDSPTYETTLSTDRAYTFQLAVKQSGSGPYSYASLLAQYTRFEQIETEVMPDVAMGSISASIPPKDGEWFRVGSTVTFTATPSPHYRFVKWTRFYKTTGNEYDYSTNNHITFVVGTQPSGVFRAYFEWDGTDLLVNSANLGSPVQLVYDPATNKLVADF